MGRILLRTGFIASVLFFGIYVFMIIAGNLSCLCGAGDSFYCNFFCWFGRALLLVASLSIISLLGYDIYRYKKAHQSNTL